MYLDDLFLSVLDGALPRVSAVPEPAATPAGAAAAGSALVSGDELSDYVGRTTRLAELHRRHDTVLLLDDAATRARPVAGGIVVDHVGAIAALAAAHAGLRCPHSRLPIKRHWYFVGSTPLPLSLECARTRVWMSVRVCQVCFVVVAVGELCCRSGRGCESDRERRHGDTQHPAPSSRLPHGCTGYGCVWRRHTRSPQTPLYSNTLVRAAWASKGIP